MSIYHILVAGDFEKDFATYLSSSTKKMFRFVSIEKITPTDLEWADAYVGFQPCQGFSPDKFKWVHTFNAGVNNFLTYENWSEQTIFTRTVCSFGERISEYVLSYMLSDLQMHSLFQAHQVSKKWHRVTPRMLRDETVIVFGTGEIGRVVGRTLSAFGTTVYGVSKSGESSPFFQKNVKTKEAGTLLPKANWVISTLPLTKETEGYFDQEVFQHLNDAVFMNVGRGATVDEPSLLYALDSGNIRHAVLDVFPQEPLAQESVLWERPDVTITPHISAVTDLKEAIACFSHTLKQIETNQNLHNRVDVSKGY